MTVRARLQRRADAARARAVDILRDFVAVGEDGDRPDARGNRGDAFPRVGENAGEARFGALRQRAALHPPPQRSDRAEPSDRVGAGELAGVAPADMVGEDLDLAAARGQGVGEAGHQDFDAAEIGREALGGEGDQGDFSDQIIISTCEIFLASAARRSNAATPRTLA